MGAPMWRWRMWMVAALMALTLSARTAASQSPARLEELTLHSAVFNNTRLVHVWLPPGYDDSSAEARRYPVFYFTDGIATLHGRRLDSIAERLTQTGVIPPTIFVMIDNGGSTQEAKNPGRDRAVEYLPYPDNPASWTPPLPNPHGTLFPQFLETEVRPLVESHVRARTDAAHVGLGGSSYGGAIALYTAIERPGHYGLLLLESPSLYIGDHALLHAMDSAHTWPDRVYIGVGTHEGETEDARHAMVADSRTLAEILSHHASTTRSCYVVVPGAEHNEDAWRARLPAALAFVLGTSTCSQG